MPTCPRCWVELPEYATFCSNCGGPVLRESQSPSLYKAEPNGVPQPRQQPQQQPPVQPPTKKRSVAWMLFAVVVVVGVVILAVSLYLVFSPHAEVTVRIDNDHWTSVEYDLYVDNNKVLNDVYIPPSHYDQQTIRVNLRSGGCESHDFYVIATDALDWSYTDSKTVTLCNGQKTTIALNPWR